LGWQNITIFIIQQLAVQNLSVGRNKLGIKGNGKGKGNCKAVL